MKKLFNAVVLLSLIVATVFTNTLVSAQSTGLGVLPRKDVTVLPGKTFSDQLNITNLNKTVPLAVRITVLDFKSADQNGTPALDLRKDAPQTPWSLRPFITLPETVTIDPGQSKNVPYTIAIPQGQGAGSYYSAIRYDAQGTGGGNVSLTAAAATLAFVTVPGRATELMTLKQFGAYVRSDKEDNGNFKSFYVTTTPQKFAYILENVGNVAEDPSGSILIKNIFGKKVKLVSNANEKNSLALIDQTRRFETCISPTTKTVGTKGQEAKQEVCGKPKFAPGIYKANLSLFYGINGSQTQEINTTATFWYMPPWFIGVILVILAAVAFVVYRVRKRLIGTTSHKRKR